MHDVIVVGGGIIGLAIARQVRSLGRSVLVLDRAEPGEGASWAAAGMITPQSEADSPSPFFQLCLASHRLYRSWIEGIQDETGITVDYVESGLVFLAPTADCLNALHGRFSWHAEHRLPLERLSERDVRSIEPLITMPVAGGFFMPSECQVTPRKLARALKEACSRTAVTIRSGTLVQEVIGRQGRVEGVRAGGEVIPAPVVVIASGAWTTSIGGLRPPIPVSPRRGQILSLRMPGPAFHHMVRWGDHYAVPRPTGDLVIGATNEDVGFDRSLTPSGVGQLLTAAQQMSDHLASFPIDEMWSGLRPVTPDDLPVLGRSSLEGLVFATGHYRNGVLLAPITAALIGDIIENRSPSAPLESFAPSRFEV